MKYKNLLALHSIEDPITSLKPAIAFAKDIRAKLEVRVLNHASPMASLWSLQNPNNIRDESIADAYLKTEQRVGEVKDCINKLESNAIVTSSYQQLGLLDEEVSGPALFSDLVIYHRCEQSLTTGMMSKALDGVIFDAGKPALVLTQNTTENGCNFKSVCIAWDPVPEAMRALTASLPLLKRALNISIVVVCKNKKNIETSSKTRLVIEWLHNHNINADVEYVLQKSETTSEALVNHVNSGPGELLVMGAYGHSRLSERVFSGVSHTLLDKSEKSLFIAH